MGSRQTLSDAGKCPRRSGPGALPHQCQQLLELLIQGVRITEAAEALCMSRNDAYRCRRTLLAILRLPAKTDAMGFFARAQEMGFLKVSRAPRTIVDERLVGTLTVAELRKLITDALHWQEATR